MIDTIGNTPTVNMDGMFLKLEYMNPSGSHKDRIALSMIKDAEKKGLKKGSCVVEYTSGNTGIAVTWIARSLGYRPIIILPENVTPQKERIIKLLGGKVIRIPSDIDGYQYAESIARECHGIYLAQTKNPANFRAHYETTAPELLTQVPKLNIFVMGVGTGGTFYGIAKYLKERDREIKCVMVIPRNSMLQEEIFGKKEEDEEILEGFSYHSISTIIKKILDENLADDVMVAGKREAMKGMKLLASRGIPGGPTAGAQYYFANKLKKENAVATLVPDLFYKYPKIMEELSH